MQTPSLSPSVEHSWTWFPLYLGLTTAFILVFLKPFSIVSAEINLLFYLLISGYAVVNAAGIYLLLMAVRSLYGRGAISGLPREALFVLTLMVVASLISWGYASLLHHLFDGRFGFEFPPKSLEEMTSSTVLILALPVTLFVAYTRLVTGRGEMKRSDRTAAELPRDEVLVLTCERKSDSLRVPAGRISHLRNEDNYVSVYYTGESGVLRRKMLRSSLARMESLLREYPFFRCHQSYIVNLDHITECRRSEGRLILYLRDAGEMIPVSRRRESSFTEQYQSLLS